jgi:hypothetical protein
MPERRRSADRSYERRSRRYSPAGLVQTPRRRILAVLIGLTLLGGTVAIAQMSNAGTGRQTNASRNCTNPPTNPPSSPTNPDPTSTPESVAGAGAADAQAAGADAQAAGADAHNHDNDAAAEAAARAAQAQAQAQQGQSGRRRCTTSSSSTTTSSGPAAPAPPVVQPDSPGASCDNSNLPVHDGFQNGGRCVATDRGEVPTAENAPSLLIVSSPLRVRVNQPFQIRISTRNLVRNFFLPAATGGYYVTRSFLNEEGILNGHVHTAIRPLSTTRSAPDAAPVPTFFKATEDGLGGKTPDTFVVEVPTGIATPGLYQIASWCGDASHAVPMAQRANQTPCFDAVRILVTRR